VSDLLDLPAGSVVALQVPGSTAYVEVVLALLGRGIVPAPLDPRLTEAETGGVLEDLEPAAHVTDPAQVDVLAQQVEGEPRRTPLARPMHLTSGTTGRPKGVWSGVLTEQQGRALVEEERELWGFRSDDVNLVVSPLHHSAPLRFAMGTLLAGGRLVVPGPFDTARLTEAIVTERPTTAFCVPTHLARLFAHWDEVGTPDLTSFRLLAHAGAACPQPVKERLLETFPAGTTWEFYGSTEGQFTACPGEEWQQRPGTVGRARPGRRITVDEDRTIWCVVPEHARFSYYRSPAKTAEAWRETPEGPAFTVGDHGWMDEDGYLYLDGRREDLVISGGVNVYPAEVEDVLSAVPGVRQVAVFGRDDPDWGQRVCAAYVGDADPADLAAAARERLSAAKRPKEYHRLDDLPHTATGKVQRLLLPDLLDGAERP
jgi:long-chain acyl-CoA synthetase